MNITLYRKFNLSSVQALIATPRRRLTLLPLALFSSFAVGLILSTTASYLAGYQLPDAKAAGETNVLDPASYNPGSDFYRERVFRFQVVESNGIVGTADITVSPENNGITRQVN